MSRNHVNRQRMSVLRLAVLARDDWTCRRCGRWGNECDHVTPLDRGGAAYDMANCQTLCTGCHIEKTRAENCREPDPEEAKWREFVAGLV
ncbi:MAG: HNH endonuclease signature motif containing protein [Rhodospirillales bacterium]|nr:HNH endonuclease signature motif containing protein [Rhodospirillales bacterium]